MPEQSEETTATVDPTQQPASPPAPVPDLDTPPAEYDASAKQRIPVMLPLGDEQIEITLIFDPNAEHQSFDRHLKEYARRAATQREADTDADLLLARDEALTDAAVWLFDKCIVDLEGIGDEGEEKPADWRNIFSPQEKKTVIERAILHVYPADSGKRGARPSWKQQADFTNSTIRLRCIFDGYEIETKHVLRKADVKTLRDFTSEWSKANGSPSEEVAAFYRKLKVEAHGYKDDIIPLHHMAAAVGAHLFKQARVLRKN